MRAAWYERNGPAREVLTVGDIETPEPGPGELRVRVKASGVNPSDVKSRAGRPLVGPRVIPHSDGAGIVEAVGEGVADARLGERVWLWNGQWQRPFGTAAEFIVLPAAQAARLPESVDFAAGACFGIPALTALQAVRLAERQAGPLQGRTVLVIGAAASVGHYAAQMAALRGATVIGTVGSPEKAAHASAAGVTATIDYKREDVAARVGELTGGRGADVVIDMDFSSTAALLARGVLVPHGTVVCYGSNAMGDVPVPFRDLLFRSLTLCFFLVYELTSEDRHSALAALTELLEAGVLTHTVAARFPLDKIADAHEAVEQGRYTGNVVVDLP